MNIGTKVMSISKSGYLSIGETYFIVDFDDKTVSLKRDSNTLSSRVTIEGVVRPKKEKSVPVGEIKRYSLQEFREKFTT